MPLFDTVKIVLSSVFVDSGLPTDLETPSTPWGSCWDHEDCKIPELGRACAKDRWEKNHNDPVYVSRYTYETTEWQYPKNGRSYEAKIRRTIEATVYRKYAGLVCAEGVDFNVQVMSDVWDNIPYVIVLETDGPQAGTYQKIRRYSGPGVSVDCHLCPYFRDEVDASPEILQEFKDNQEADRKEREEARKAKEIADRAAKEEKERKTPRKGRTVKVVRGRKVPIGTVGECFWVGESTWGKRIGMKVNGATVWVDYKNVEAVS